MPFSVTRERFEEIALQEMKKIPKKFLRKFGNVSVIVEDLPDDDAVRETGIPRTELMGLFRGEGYGEHEAFFHLPSPYPDAIYLYQKNIEAVCESEAELREEIRMTVLHEVGHYFGMTEEELDEFENQ